MGPRIDQVPFVVRTDEPADLGQLEGLVGIEIDSSHPLTSVAALLGSATDWHLLTCLTGLASMGFILAIRKYIPRAPYAILLVTDQYPPFSLK